MLYDDGVLNAWENTLCLCGSAITTTERYWPKNSVCTRSFINRNTALEDKGCTVSKGL